MKLLITRIAILMYASTGLIWVIAMFGFACFAARVIGHWPIPMINDPKLIDFKNSWASEWFLAVFLGGPITAFSVITFPMIAWYFKPDLSGKIIKARLALYILSVTVGLIVARFDPGRCWEWIMD